MTRYVEKTVETLKTDEQGRAALDLLCRTYDNGSVRYFSRIRVEKLHLSNNIQRVCRSLRTDDLDEAKNRALEQFYTAKVRQDNNQTLRALTVNEVIDRFFVQYEDALKAGREGFSQHMLRGFRKNVDIYWREYIGERNVDSLTTEDLENYEDFRQNWAKTTARKRSNDQRYKSKIALRTLIWEINAMRFVLRWASTRNIYAGAVYEWQFKTRGVKTRRSAFTIEQYRKLHRYMRSKAYYQVGKHKDRGKYDSRIVRHRHMLRAYILFMANCGLRVGEARFLKFSDISERKNKLGQSVCVIRIDEEKSKVTRSKTAFGNVVGRVTALKAIKRWKDYKESIGEDVSGDSYIFSNQYGKVLNDLREGFKQVLKEAGVEKDAKGNNLVIYSLRHTFISWRLQYGKVNVHNLAKNCRTSVSMIEGYYDDTVTTDFVDELTV